MASERSEIYGTMRVGDAQIGVAIDQLAEVVGPLHGLSPILTKSDSLLGGLDLRGDLVAVLDPAVICGAGQAIQSPKFAAILRHNGRILGVGVDEITGLANVSSEDICAFDGNTASISKAVKGGFLEEGRVVTVIDIARIFAMADGLSVAAAQNGVSHKKDSTQLRTLTFEAGSVLFSVAAIDVYGTVPRQAIEHNSLASGPCLGSITYHGRRIPVMDTVSVMGVGKPTRYISPEVVVLRYPDDRLLGFAVDAIREIEAVDPDDLVAVPASINAGTDYLSQVRIQNDDIQIYSLNIEAMRNDPSLLSFAKLADQFDTETGIDPSDDVSHERQSSERYLFFDAGEPMAVPLSQVNRVLLQPQAVTPLVVSATKMQGFFAHEGRSVPYIDLRSLDAKGDTDQATQRVLLVGDGLGWFRCG